MIIGGCNAIATLVSIFTVNKFSRRTLFLKGGIQMFICQIVIIVAIACKFGLDGNIGMLPKWCRQTDTIQLSQLVVTIETILDGLDLYKFLDGSHPTLVAFINNTDTPPVSQANPAYLSWKRQDRLIYGALLTTLSDSVASLITQTKTSVALWSTLKGTFARASRGHVKQLKDCLHSTVKGTLSVTDS
ncbi:Retrovirus-related Pol polyprotein from transposon RE1 Retro element 1 [Vigna angularis]|uniref:Retrovirus-related Pol polyprotein from transposon RE1 Retro element 1 n=1 Tax=Phaseolus angularis TaxID=3914 RepID=A0A8T0KC04_PHAAN|nr:Retrovirus-related Pol polyprotein from transposon RE1 Retro element 1 [Vigna angularis]